MRISDWSSDVCSSDLCVYQFHHPGFAWSAPQEQRNVAEKRNYTHTCRPMHTVSGASTGLIAPLHYLLYFLPHPRQPRTDYQPPSYINDIVKQLPPFPPRTTRTPYHDTDITGGTGRY